MNHYETVFIVTPVLSEAQVKEAVQKFRDLITENGGEIVNDEFWGLKKLAYPIQKKSTGFYQLFQFNAEPDFIQRLEVEYKRDERLIRFLTFKLDKHAIEWAEKRISRKKDNKKNEPAKTEKK
ncbi:MAG: 30S ribosomal protein S6 [Bacteroidales bacterium]